VAAGEEKVVMTRIYDAPRSRVFEAWTRAEHLEKWFGPTGFAITDCESDPRPGGVFRLRWRSPRGEAYRVNGSYRGVTFEQHGSRTRLSLNSTASGLGPQAARMLASMQKGWAQTVDRLSALLFPNLNREKEM
jgi:uncharacterized protein YndB with AHSA1/START domain